MSIAAISAGDPGQSTYSTAPQSSSRELRNDGTKATIEALEVVIEDFLKVLENGRASSASTGPVTAPVSVAPPPPSPAPAMGGAGVPGGTNVNIDGGNAQGLGVTETVANNTGAAAEFGWENAQGRLVGTLDLSNGQSGTFDVNAAGADGKSARLIKLDADGSIPVQSNLDEQNVTTNPNGSIQNSPDVSEITSGNDPIKITITDGNGKTVGNGAPGGAYLYPTQDQQVDPADNPMTMAMDTSNRYVNDFTN